MSATTPSPRCAVWTLAACAGALTILAVLSVGSHAVAETPGLKLQEKAKHRAMVELGRRLFFDPVVSRGGTTGCAACHDPEHGFSDKRPFSRDDVGETARHAQTLLDSAFNPSAHWDGEFARIEELVRARIGLTRQGPYGDPPELRPLALLRGEARMSRPPDVDESDGPVIRTRHRNLENELDKLPRAQDILEHHGRYANSIRHAFGDASLTRARVSRAIAAYCRTITHTVAPFDRWRAGDKEAMGAAAVRGFKLFQGRAGCAQCHVLTPAAPRAATSAGRRAAFTDYDFHNNGVGWLEARTRETEAENPAPRAFVLDDPGRGRIADQASTLRRAFKTPTLRDVTRRGPFMHNAVFNTLEEVVRHYARGGSDDPKLDKRIRPFKVSDHDVADLVAFLHALEGTERPGLAPRAHAARPERTRLDIVDARGRPLRGLRMRILPAGDRLPAEAARSVPLDRTTDKHGSVSYTPPAHTHVTLELPRGIRPEGGFLVPDTCSRARIVLPVDGTTHVVLMLPAGAIAPEALKAVHLGTTIFEGAERPHTRLERTHVFEGKGYKAARYTGWMRADVPPRVRLDVPGPDRKVTLRKGKTLTFDLR